MGRTHPLSRPVGSSPHARPAVSPARLILWWCCLFVAPLALLGIELFHPAGFTHDPGAYAYLSQAEPHQAQHQALAYFGPAWWVALHLIQTPLVGLIGIGMVVLLATFVPRTAPRSARFLAGFAAVATFIFVIYYTALDSIGGVGLGRSILATERLAAEGRLTPAQVAGVALVLDATWTDPVVGGVGSFISELGSWAVFVAALCTAAALYRAGGVPWPPLLLLIAFGWELQVSHTMPHGPIAFGLLSTAALWLWWATARLSRSRGEPASAPD